MGSAASVPPSDAPALSREQYIEEHHRFWDLSQKQEWAEVYKLVKSQTSVGALNALGEANYQNCARISCRAIAKITASPKDFDEIVEMLCRCAAAAGWSAGTAACFVTHSTKRDAIREEVLRQAAGALADAGAEAQAAAMLEEIAKQEGGAAGHLGYAVLMASRSCMAEERDDLALKLLNAYLPKNKPPEPYDAGDLLALWYALRWRDSGRKATKVGKMAICIFKSSHIKIIVDDGGELFDGGVSHWEDEQELREQTVPEIMRDWRLWSDAMCFLTDGAIAFEPVLVDACWDFMPKAHNPFWDSKYVRCISQSNFHEKDFVDIMRAWEEKYMAEKGGESDILGFHLLYPAKRPDLKVDVVMGGIATNTISHRAFKGRPFYMDEGVLWTHHHRVFWMFHESHHKYESEFQDQFDFAELIKKSDHPMFMKELWMDEFKGENEVFPGSHWHGENEFDWYVQCITRRLKEMSPSLADCWLSWWGGKEEEALGAYHDWVSEHHVMWEAFQAQDWPKVLEVYESQLRAMCEEKLGEQNYKNVVNMSVKALVASEKALDAEVLAAIKTGLKVLELEADQAGELMHHLSAEQKQEVLKMLPASEKVKKRVAKQQKAISIIDDHHQMWDAYQNQEWHKVLEHQELQVSQQARERLGDGNYQNCFRMLFQAMGSGLTSPKDVNRAVDLLRKGMETTGWGIEVFEPLLSNHARKFQVMQPFAPSEDAEGKYHDFVSEHHAMWDAYQKQDWEKVCSFVDSQLRPLCLARLGEQNYGNVTRMAVQSLASAGRALDGAVLAALKKGLEVLGSGAERAAEFTNGLPPEQAAELLKLL